MLCCCFVLIIGVTITTETVMLQVVVAVVEAVGSTHPHTEPQLVVVSVCTEKEEMVEVTGDKDLLVAVMERMGKVEKEAVPVRTVDVPSMEVPMVEEEEDQDHIRTLEAVTVVMVLCGLYGDPTVNTPTKSQTFKAKSHFPKTPLVLGTCSFF